jgi:hypothetical protein
MAKRRIGMATYAVTFAERAGSTVSIQVNAQRQDEAIQQAALAVPHPNTAIWLGTVREVSEITP